MGAKTSLVRAAAILGLLLAAILVLFGRVIFLDENFVYRDAAHFYYPLFNLVTEEILTGRVPLWNVMENSGQPLAANPAASVFYPIKAVFLLLPYPTAYKAYTLVHLLACFWSAYLLFGHWGLGAAASVFGAWAYTFGGYVLFQYCNIVFLCGAAWLPLVILAGERVIAGRSVPWIVALGATLAMTVLSGDPEAGYLAGGALLMRLALSWGRGPQRHAEPISWRRLCAPGAVVLVVTGIGVAWHSVPAGTGLRVLGSLVLVHLWLPTGPRRTPFPPAVGALAVMATVAVVAILLAPSKDVFLAGPAEHDRYAGTSADGRPVTLSPKELLKQRQAAVRAFQPVQLGALAIPVLIWCAVMLRHWKGAARRHAGQRHPAGLRRWAPLVVPAVLWAGLGVSIGRRVLRFESDVAELTPDRQAGARTDFYELEVLGWAVRFLCVLIAYTLWRRWRSTQPQRGPATGSDHRAVTAMAAAVVVAGVLAAVQIAPSWEFSRYSLRSVGHDEAPRSPYAFSVHPARLVEFVLPNLTGHLFPDNSMWINRLAVRAQIWTPTSYMGILVVLFAGVACARLRREPTIAWLAAVLGLSVLAALGKHLTLYPILYEALPGFSLFRYPAKVMVLTALALAGLGAFGFQRVFAPVRDGQGPNAVPGCLAGAAGAIACSSAVAALLVWLHRDGIAAWLRDGLWAPNLYGPPNVQGAVRAILGALEQTAVAAAGSAVIVLAFARQWWRRSVWPLAAISLLAVDLVVANGWTVVTGPQAIFDTKSDVVDKIEEDAARQGYDREPYRVHRTEIYTPYKFLHNRATGPVSRPVEGARWEAKTIQPKYGLLAGVHYVHTVGTISLYDYAFFFGPFYSPSHKITREGLVVPNRFPARGRSFVYHPRNSYDLWNTRYFVLPKFPVPPDDEYRGTLAFLADVKGEPLPIILQSEGGIGSSEDYLVVRNTDAFPRTWIVHQHIPVPPVVRATREARTPLMDRLIYKGDRLWNSPRYERRRIDWRRTVVVERPVDQAAAWRPVGEAKVSPNERSRVVRYEPQYARIEATLEEPGWLVMSDTWYPGWTCKVDGRARPIERANRMMRAVALEAGAHTVEFLYRPTSFRVGLWITLLGAVGVVTLLACRGIFRSTRRRSSAAPAGG